MLAFLAAFSASFAMKADQSFDQALYYINQNDEPVAPVTTTNPRCSASELKCARMFTVVGGVPTEPSDDEVIEGTRF